MKTVAGLIKHLLDVAFDTNTPVSAGFGDDSPHYTIVTIDIVEDDQTETGYRIVLRLGETMDSVYRLKRDLENA